MRTGTGKRLILLSAALLVLWGLLATVLRDNLGSPGREFNDYVDRWDYFQQASWIRTGAVPYRDMFSEYPQVANLLFALVYLPFLGQPHSSALFPGYSAAFALVMSGFLVGLVAVLDRMLPDNRKLLAFAMLLPAPLYFTYNRFDVLPSLLALLALLMARKARWEAGAVLLGIGAMTKWFPALLVAPVAGYMITEKVRPARVALFLALFAATCGLIVLPTYVLGGTRAVWTTYASAGGREFDLASLPALISPALKVLPGGGSDQIIKLVFLVLQFCALPIVLISRIDGFKRLVAGSLLVIAVFVLFSRLYSPQWMLWLLPLMILLAEGAGDLLLIAAYGILTYVEYPLISVPHWTSPAWMSAVGWMNTGLLILIIIQAARGLRSAAPGDRRIAGESVAPPDRSGQEQSETALPNAARSRAG